MMGGKRRVKSIKVELLKNATEAMLAAVQIYNNPQITFKSETFITLAVIAWTYMLHAYFRSKHIDYRYYTIIGKKKVFSRTKSKAYKYWELGRCLDDGNCPLDDATKTNLRFLIGIRHEIEHRMTDKIDEFICSKLQACAINFDHYIGILFGEKYKLSNTLPLVIQFSPLSPEQKDVLKNNPYISSNVKNFVVNFENELSKEALESLNYAYRVRFVPLCAKNGKNADQIINFIKSDSENFENESIPRVIKETEKPKYLPKDIVNLMRKKGYCKFSINKHTDLWKSQDAKNPKFNYGVRISDKWYWYGAWVKKVQEYCEQNANILKD